MQVRSLKEHYKKEVLLTEQIQEEELNELISNLEKMDQILDSADIPEIDQKVDDARDFLSKVQSGEIKPGIFGLTGKGRQMRQQLNNVKNATVQVANLLQNMNKILTLSGKGLVGRIQRTGAVEQGDNVADVLNRIQPAATNRMKNLIKSYLQPKWLRGKSAINADAAANQIIALEFSQFQDFIRQSSASGLQQVQATQKEEPDEAKTASEKLLSRLGIGGEEGKQPGQENLKKAISLLQRNKNMSKNFVATLDILKGALGRDFQPRDLESVYQALR